MLQPREILFRRRAIGPRQRRGSRLGGGLSFYPGKICSPVLVQAELQHQPARYPNLLFWEYPQEFQRLAYCSLQEAWFP